MGSNMNISVLFESLFKMDPIIHGLAMTPIYEEDSGSGNSNKVKQKSGKYNTLGSSYTGTGCSSAKNGFTSVGNGSETFQFERSGSTKSVPKSRSPLSRLWQMRRRSFSQFELSSVGMEDGGCSGEKELGTRNGGTGNGLMGRIGNSSGSYSSHHELSQPFDEHRGTTGHFHLIGDHFWGSESDISLAPSPSPFKRKVIFVYFIVKK